MQTKPNEEEATKLKTLASEIREGIEGKDEARIVTAAQELTESERKFGFITKPHSDSLVPKMTADIKALLEDSNNRRLNRTLGGKILKLGKALLGIIKQRLDGITKPLMPLALAAALAGPRRNVPIPPVETHLWDRIKTVGEALFSGGNKRLLSKKPRPEILGLIVQNSKSDAHPTRALTLAATVASQASATHTPLDALVSSMEETQKEIREMAFPMEKKQGYRKDMVPAGP
jgi:hypothetical protein